MEKPFWSDGSVELNVLQRPLEIVVKSERITSWLWCATFINPHRTLAAQCQSGGTARWWLGMGALVWSINGKSSRDTNQYFSRADENSQSFQAGCLKKFGHLFSDISHPRCPLFLHTAVSGSLYHRDWNRGSCSRLCAVGNLATSSDYRHTLLQV